MNDSEAACFGAEALEYHCSVYDLVRLAVRPVNSGFDIFIRILFYLNITTSDEKTQGNSLELDRHGLVNTKTPTGSSEAWSIFLFFFWGGGGVRGQMTLTRLILWASLEVNLCPILKQTHRCKAIVIS